MSYVPVAGDLHLQIVPTISAIPVSQKHHFAAFVQDTALLVVWDDDPRHCLERAEEIEKRLMEMVWDTDPATDEKKAAEATVTEVPVDADGHYDPEATYKPRKIVLTQAILTGLTLMMLVAAIGSGWRNIAQEIMIDGSMFRVAFAAIVPLQVWLALVRLSLTYLSFTQY